jgi:hypothetical protein
MEFGVFLKINGGKPNINGRFGKINVMNLSLRLKTVVGTSSLKLAGKLRLIVAYLLHLLCSSLFLIKI